MSSNHYLKSNEEIQDLCNDLDLSLPTVKIGEKVRLKKDWLDIYIDIMQTEFFPDRVDRLSSSIRPREETISNFKGGDTCIITNKYIAVGYNISKETIWWSGSWRTMGNGQPDYFFDQCFEPIVTNMYSPKKFIYESFDKFNKQIR